jgi:hypothetical protein
MAHNYAGEQREQEKDSGDNQFACDHFHFHAP